MTEEGRRVVVESSVVARGLRRVGAFSSTALRGSSGWDAPGADADALRIIERSRLVESGQSILDAVAAAWRDRLASGAIAALVDEFRALQAAERVRLCGWMLLVAALTTASWRGLAGTLSSSATLPIVATLAAVAMMRWSGSLVVAWTDRFGDPQRPGASGEPAR